MPASQSTNHREEEEETLGNDGKGNEVTNPPQDISIAATKPLLPSDTTPTTKKNRDDSLQQARAERAMEKEDARKMKEAEDRQRLQTVRINHYGGAGVGPTGAIIQTAGIRSTPNDNKAQLKANKLCRNGPDCKVSKCPYKHK